jgi:hypothetical protein
MKCFFTVGIKRKHSAKDSYDIKLSKSAGKKTRLDTGKSSKEDVCADCYQPGHKTKRAMACPLNNSKEKVFQDKLGKNHETFTRKVYLSSVIKPGYKALFTNNVTKLSTFIRNVIFRAQIFVNCYIIEKRQDNFTDSYIFQRNFWYSICQLIMCVR